MSKNNVPTEVLKNAIRAMLAGDLEETLLSYDPERGRSGHCTMRVYQEGDCTVLVCTERRDNDGMSITNAAPAPWEAAEDEAPLGSNVAWLEHYGPESGDGRAEHVFELVTLDVARTPRWKRIATIQATAAA